MPCPPLGTSGVHLGPRWHRQSHAPYPAGMREQPLGPNLCLLASKPATRSCYSTLTPHWGAIDENDIHTECARADTERYTQRTLHTVGVAYTDVDWKGPRETAGWTALQWQALTWTALEVTGTDAPVIAFSISGAPEFALVPADQEPQPSSCIEWYRGDYYGYDAVQANQNDSLDSRPAASVPHLITVQPGKYYLMVKTLYEIRVMGDPHGVPRVKFTADLEVQRKGIEADLTLITSGHRFLYPDVVDGRVAGSGADNCALVSVAVRNSSPRAYRMHSVGVHSPGTKADSIGLGEVAPFATVKVNLRIWFDEQIQTTSTGVKMSLCLVSTGGHPSAYRWLELTVPLEHVTFSEEPEVDCSYKVTYLGPSGVEMAVIVPPLKPSTREAYADTGLTIVVLHGAGVDVEGTSMRRALRRQNRSWVVLPTGITPWGLDWQQASFHSWRNVLFEQEWYRPLTDTRPSGRYFLMGHSNGGQGAWYGLTHLSDRFVGGVVAAGYMSLQEYVPFSWTEGRHSTDPILRAVLDAALNDYRNDMHASNLVGMPLLVKYGADDDNVPPWHSRAMVSLIDDWNAESDVKKAKRPRIVEVPHRGHWWDEIFQEADVQAVIDAAESDTASARVPPSKFTVTCSDPSEMHSMFGWKIVDVDLPGRVARLEVEYVDATEGGEFASLHLRTTNIRRLQVEESSFRPGALERCNFLINEGAVDVEPRMARDGTLTLHKEQRWSLVDGEALASLSRPRQISSITSLLTVPRFLLVIPATSLVQGSDGVREKAYASVARRWAADLLLHISADVRIVTDEYFLRVREEALQAAVATDQERLSPPSPPVLPLSAHAPEAAPDSPYSIPLGLGGEDWYDDPIAVACRTDDDYAEYYGESYTHGSGHSFGYGFGQGFGSSERRRIAEERRREEEYEELCEALRAGVAEEEERQREEQRDVERRSWVFFGGPKENKAVPHRGEDEEGSASNAAFMGRSSATSFDGIDFIQHLSQEQWKIGQRVFSEPGMALLYSLPHPNPPHRSLVLTGSSCPAGIERAGRLLPVRTGTALPEWVVLGERADRFAAGAGGVMAAGWYDRSWGFSEAMSYLG